MTAKEMREKRAEMAAEIRKLADKQNDSEQEWLAEDEERWVAVNAEYDAMTAKIEKTERADALDAEQDAIADAAPGREDRNEGPPDNRRETPGIEQVTGEDRAMALRAWCRASYDLPVAAEDRDAAQRCGVDVAARFFDIRLKSTRELRASTMNATDSGYGGETIPAGFVSNFEAALLQYGGIRNVAEVIRTDSGNELTWPTTNDTGNSGALIAEKAADSVQEFTTSSMTLNAYKYTSKIVQISAELLEDSAFDLASFIGSILGERLGRITASHFATGTGSGQPNGIETAATLGVTAAGAAAITADEVIDLYHSVDPAYRVGAGWAMHDNVVLYIRKLKDDDGQYLWQPGLVAGVPDTLLTAPVTVCQEMASTVESSAKTVLFGQLSKYKVRDVGTLRLKRLVERYAEYDVEGFVALSRHDGDLLDAGTHPVKYLQQASGGGS